MPDQFHFISGLPRSGSTLLSGLLRQNPRFHASMSGPMNSMVNGLLREMSQGNEYSLFMDLEKRQRIIKACFQAYYQDVAPREVVFDTGRMWTAKLPVLSTLFPQAKVICCVRNISWVLDSFEGLTRRNCFEPSKIYNFDPTNTVYSRVEGLMSSAGIVGASLFALREAVYGGQADRLMLVRYESLVADPLGVLGKIYSFIGEPMFLHDPKKIEPLPGALEFDARLGTPGLHDLGPVVRRSPRPTVLPLDLFKRYEGFTFWDRPDEMPKGVRIV